jgi:hypothetical protein
MKYTILECKGFMLPDNPWDKSVDFFNVKVAKESWDEIEDDEDKSIFYYMDGMELTVGDIISDNFVITEIYNEISRCSQL